MFVELQAAVEDAGGRVISPDTLNEIQSVRELLTAVQRVDKRKKMVDEPKAEERTTDEIFIPSIVRRVGNQIIDFAQDRIYDNVLKTRHRRRIERPAAHEFYRRAEPRFAH